MERRRIAVGAGLLVAATALIVLLPFGAGPRDDSAAPLHDSTAALPPLPGEADSGVPVPPAAPEPGTIRGVVVDGEGHPVAGAEVAAARDGEPRPVRVPSGDDGRFALAGLDPDGEYLLGARAPGFAPVMAGGSRPGGGEVRLVLRPGVELGGEVLDGEGRPCAGALVRATLRYPGVAKEIPGLEVRADEEGRYRFVGIPPVPGEVRATWKEHAAEPRPFEPAPGARTVRVDLVVPLGPGISGIVRDAEGRPLGGIRVTASAADGKGYASGATGDDGTFSLRGLRPVPHKVRVSDLDFQWHAVSFEAVIPPRAGLEATLLPNAAAPGRLEYRVLDSRGRPVPQVRIVEYRAGEPGAAGSGSDGPDPDGVFRSAQVQQGRWRWILRAGEEVVAAEFEVARGRATDLGTLRLAPGAEVRGRLACEEGIVAVDARVHDGEDPIPEKGMPDADGSFVLRGLAPPEGVVRVLHPRCEVLEIPWRCGAGARVDLGEARLRPARGALRGSVRSRRGTLPAGVVVEISREGAMGASGLDRRAPVGTDGRFEFREVPAGSWRSSAVAPDPAREGFSRGRAGPRVELREGEEREIEIVVD